MESAGAIDPWHTRGERYPSPCWKVDGYETPFAALSELIQNWPGSTQTSEQMESVRHQRLVETIAGYPEIASGRRPLDMPLHSRSILAFKLSKFLDEIPDSGKMEWHSLKTGLLHFDLRAHASKKKTNMPYPRFFQHFVSEIRTKSSYLNEENIEEYYLENELHSDEIEFITVLHSQSDDAGNYWPINEKGDIGFSTLTDEKLYLIPTKLNLSTERNTFIEHEFKFQKIQTWINKWTSCAFIAKPWLSKNVSHQLVVGASVVLESIFAKMRSYILREKRPGSLIIDGGGRLRYLSLNSPEDEAEWFREKITNALLFDPEHLHPYQDLIRETMNGYVNQVFKYIKENFSKDQDQYIFPKFFKDGSDETSQLTTLGFNELLGSDITAEFLPKITKGEPEINDVGEPIYDTLIEAEGSRWEFKKCVLCQEEKRHEHTYEKDTINQITKVEGAYVCPHHALLYKIGKKSKLRSLSYPDLFKRSSRKLKPQEQGIKTMLMFDGNAIGQLFNKPFNDWKAPQVDEEEIMSIWNSEKSAILNVNETWDDQKLRKKYPKLGLDDLYSRRMQVMVRKQRRSFLFNANWWVSLQHAISNTPEVSLVPWIMAGDDLVMVNHLEVKTADIKRMLTKFQTSLSESYSSGEVNITFAGSLQHRGKDDIVEMYKKARQLEEEAAYYWKWHANRDSVNTLRQDGQQTDAEEWSLLHRNKLEKLQRWTNSKKESQIDAVMAALKENNFTYDATGGYLSLIISSDMNVA